MFYKNISVIEVENSTICNARCPQCLREELAFESISYEQKYLPVEFFDRIPVDVYNNLKKIHFAGTLGDPCAAPNFLEVIKFVKSKNKDLIITISTNGGMKSPEWWKELADLLSPTDSVMFAIDGLENTNHIYRVNVNWNSLIRNVKSFIEHGGNASWQFIVFRHNQHQIDQARNMAKDLKFKEFLVKKSHRFPITDIKGLKLIGGDDVPIEPSTDGMYVNEIKFIPNYKTWKEDTKNLTIDCDAQIEESVYIDVEGRLFPCCYIAASLYQFKTAAGQFYNQGWDEFWKTYGDNNISLYSNDWQNILTGSFYNEVQRKWTSDDRLNICTFFCGGNGKSPIPVNRENI